MSIKDELIRAKAVIEDPKNWTIGAFAVNQHGTGVSANDSTACRFCALGAMLKIHASSAAIKHLTCVADKLDPLNGVTGINDTKGHAATLELFDKAIESAS